MAEVKPKKPGGFDQRLRDGEPLMECVIEPPFQVALTNVGVQVDAPCLQFKELDSLGVLRVTFTPEAAVRLRDALNQLTIAETTTPGSATLQ